MKKITRENITSKERAELRSKAQTLKPIVMVGRDGVTDNVCAALSEALEYHELVKVRFQNHKEETFALSTALETATDSILVATTGFTAVFFKQKEDK